MSFAPSWLTRSSWFRFLRTAAASRVSEPAVIQADLKVRLYDLGASRLQVRLYDYGPAVIQADLKVRLYEYGPGAYRSAHLRSRLWYTAVNWTAAG